ncbi:Protein of unknown function DUF58 [Neorhodopirellula lusitana]|uniref:DUF58 domain-containing protein n=1 Tax=Neorhodopirellula lusitana TaxID=445327 RepID=A0ABY1Q9K0_9BACT|nr:Protein of unknown function DUF58 [Neorhodopirellula lusitana]
MGRSRRNRIDVSLRVLSWLNPIRWLRSLRRSLTPASVTLLLIGIISLNIVWGYPWLGMFAACFACLVVGRAVNYFASPRLKAFVQSARAVPVGCDLAVPTRLVNQRRLPAMDLIFEQTHHCRYVGSLGEVAITPTLRFSRRGKHALPAILVDSYFPFYLFRERQWVASDASIVVTPKRLFREQDSDWLELELTLKGLASQAAQGDQIHYIGSREYREGVPVRRWDFSSWARLGKPILREFSTPAAKSVRVVIDCVRPQSASPDSDVESSGRLSRWLQKCKPTSKEEAAKETGSDTDFEHALSLAAAAVETLVQSGAAVVLEVRSMGDANDRPQLYRCEAGSDPVELLVVLGNAQAEYIDDQSYQNRQPRTEGPTRQRDQATVVIEPGQAVKVAVGAGEY